MLTLSEFKSNLEVTDDTQDSVLQSIVNKAKSFIDSYCNTEFAYGNREIILNFDEASQYAVIGTNKLNSIVSIESLDSDGNGYTTIFDDGDTVSDSLIFENWGRIRLTNGYMFNAGTYKVVYNSGYKFTTLTGTMTVSKGSVSVTGTSTLYTSELSVGDSILIQSELRTIATITSNTALTVTEAFADAHTAQVGILSNYPEDLRDACLYVAIDNYNNSPAGNNRFGKNNFNQGGQSSNGESYKADPLEFVYKSLNKYRVMNV